MITRKARPVIATGRTPSSTMNRNNLFAYRRQSNLAGGGGGDTHSWRAFYQVHPACDAWPELTAEQRQSLKADIEANFIKVPIQTRSVAGESQPHVIDGRTRLDLMEELGRQIVDADGNWIGALAGNVEHKAGRTHEQIGLEVISYNGKRRHMTKHRLAECIVGTLKAVRELGKTPKATDSAKLARSVKRDAGGRLSGSTQDRFKAAAVERAKQAGISQRTVERVLSKAEPAKPRKKKQVDRLAPEYGTRRFGMFLRHWPHDEHRTVRKLLCEYLTD